MLSNSLQCLVKASMICFLLLASTAIKSTGQTIFYVNSSTGSDANPGTSWVLAYRNVTKALASANSSIAAEVQIWIAQGTYTPIDGIAPTSPTLADTSFLFCRGIGAGRALKVYGGFSGTETSISARTSGHTTYLDGYLGLERSYHIGVITGLSALSDSVVIDGITIQNGSAKGNGVKTFNGVDVARNAGGGFYLENNLTSKIAIRNCTFRFDSAIGNDNTCIYSSGGMGGSAFGGGVYVRSTQGLFANCSFVANAVVGNTGGCNVFPGTFTGTGGNASGGGLYANRADIIITSCTFNRNSVMGGIGKRGSHTPSYGGGRGGDAFGGGACFQSCTPTVSDCTLAENVAYGGTGDGPSSYARGGSSYGGGIFADSASFFLLESTFEKNVVFPGQTIPNRYGNAFGGGLCNKNCTPSVSDCTFESNLATDSSVYYDLSKPYCMGGAIANINANTSITNCTLLRNRAISFRKGYCYGGAIYNLECAPTISFCNMSENQSKSGYLHWFMDALPGPGLSGGGALANYRSSPAVSNCTFKHNSAQGTSDGYPYGSAIFNQDTSNAVFWDCVIDSNIGSSYVTFGTVACLRSDAKFIRCKFRNNGRFFSEYYGGAFYNEAGAPVIDTCWFQNNSSRYGAAIYQNSGSLAPRNCLFESNEAYYDGGAIYSTGADMKFSSINNVFKGNNAQGGRGGAIRVGSSGPYGDTIINNVFLHNTARGSGSSRGGGAISITSPAHFIYNNTFYADTASADGGAIKIESATGISRVANNIFSQCYASGTSLDTSVSGTGSFDFSNNLFSDTDPLFVSSTTPSGPDNIWGTADDGLQLQTCSPAVNTGSNAYLIPGVDDDMLGNDRVNGISIDMGAYEKNLISPISGPSTLCRYTTIALGVSPAGGTWSSSNPSVATVSSSGMVTGINQGVAIITYSRSFGCVGAISVKYITIERTAAPILGDTALCIGSTISLSDTTSSGIWSSSAPTVATVSSLGYLNGLAQGTASITYSVTNTCGTSEAIKLIAVERMASAIVGVDSVCTGASAIMTDSVSDGIWSISPTVIATISSSGVVNGITTGTATISYTVLNSCGPSDASKIIRVERPVSIITGPDSLCASATISLTDSVAGGTWTSASTSIATVGSSTGVVSGIAQGTSIISYTHSNACGITTALHTVTVDITATPITGLSAVCVGATITLTDTTLGGIWSSDFPATAAITTGGVATGVASGSVIISYEVTNACGMSNDTMLLTVDTSAANIEGDPDLCIGNTTTLSNATPGGTWSSSNTLIATASSSGVIGAVSEGTATITYSVHNSCGISTTTIMVTIDQPASDILGPTTVCEGETINLTNATADGTWISDNSTIASVSSGVVSGVSAGTTTISYTVDNSCGITSRYIEVNVLSATDCHSGLPITSNSQSILLYPVPTHSDIFINAPFKVKLVFTGVNGRQYNYTPTANGKVSIKDLPNGDYVVTILDAKERKVAVRKIQKM